MLDSSSENIAPEFAIQKSPFDFHLGFFEGPLDLLLHLVHSEEVEIAKVEMAAIAQQYLEIVSAHASSLDLDRASEYLVIAAHLIAIKSKSILPRHESDEPELDMLDLENGPNFYEELRERLRQYEIMKKRAIVLNSRTQLGIDTFKRVPDLKHFVSDSIEFAAEKPGTLAVLFMKVLQRIGVNAPKLRIKLEPVSVVDFMSRIISNFRHTASAISGKQSFLHLVRSFCVGRRFQNSNAAGAAQKVEQHTGVVIASFIGVLELVRRGVLRVEQSDSAADISIELKETSSVALDKMEVELQQMRTLEQRYTQGHNIGLPEFANSKVVNIEDYRHTTAAVGTELEEKIEVNRG